MLKKLFLWIILSVLFGSSHIIGQTVYSDALQGSTKGSRFGGSFTSEGYKPGAGNNHITYTINNAPYNGYVEFQVKGFKMSDFPKVSSTNVLDNSTFVVMYDGRGVGQPLKWSPDFRNNYFRWGIYYLGPKFGNSVSGDRFKAKMLIASPARSNNLSSGAKAVYPQINSNGELDLDWKNEPSGIRASWDPNKWYTIRISWDNDKKDYKVFRDGVEVWSMKKNRGAAWPGEHGYSSTSPYPRVPGIFKIDLGSGPRDLANYMPNIIYRNFKVVKTGGGTGPVNNLSVSPSVRNVGSAAGNTSFSVASNVSWSVSDNANWLSVSPTGGSNNQSLTATFLENTSSSSRSATLTTSGGGITRTVTVNQEGKSTSSNTLSVSPSSNKVGAAAGNTTISVASNVSWSASDNASWLSLSPTSGSNNGSITAAFSENSSTSSRTANITVSGGGITRTATVTQSGKVSTGQNYLDVPATLSLSKEAGTVVVNVKSNVSWRVYDNTGSPGWVGKSPKSGTGDGQVTIRYYANNSSVSRTGSLIFEGGGLKKIVLMTQAGKSTTSNNLAVSPGNQNVGSSAGSTNISVTSNVGWSVSDNANWLTTSPNTGSNNGNISATFTENSSTSSRTATVTVSGGGITRTATVTQAGKSNTGGGNYLNVPTTLTLPKQGGTTVVDVSSNVSWRVYDNTGSPGWLGKSPKTGTGDGKVTVRFYTNPSSNSRIGSLIFEGGGLKKVVAVTQSGSSSGGNAKFIEVPSEINLSGASGKFEVNVKSNITWYVKDDSGVPGWIGKSPKTATGNAKVTVRYYANNTGAPRSGNLIFYGQGITKMMKVNQASNSVLAKSSKSNSNIELLDEEVPTRYSMSNYPNPFNPTTTIRYAIPVAGYTEIIVYNSLGQEVKKLMSEYKSKGVYNLEFNASNLASGIYFYTLRSGKFVETMKMILVE